MDTVRFDIGGRGARWLRLLGIGLGIGFLVLLEPAGSLGTRGSSARAQQDDAAFEDEIEKGRKFQNRRQYEETKDDEGDCLQLRLPALSSEVLPRRQSAMRSSERRRMTAAWAAAEDRQMRTIRLLL